MSPLVLHLLCTSLSLGSPRVGRAFRVFSTEVRADTQPARADAVQIDVVYTAVPDFVIMAREAVRMLKERFTDVNVASIAMPTMQGSSITSFKILVDDAQVVSKRADASGVALKMSALSAAVGAARRRRRPAAIDSADDAK
ncbi:hypothetical protein KFE25_007955 [Diacronema lutheri]|uniref:Uncharacterized protein n=1 Tax=Diacronema lutheri TaxID=2081491 RepID=A0A7R9USN9_DIALT|nr:hypothetical protein KFE25_007955 [Diacronema lutheri]